MDNLTPFPLAAHMPPPSPLAQPVQDLRLAHRDPSAPALAQVTGIWLSRAVAFVPAAVTTVLLVWAFADWLSNGGLWWLEWVLVTLVALTFFWISLSVGTATLGLARLMWRRPKASLTVAPPLRVALLVPIYNEDTADVFGNACAMMMALNDTATRHRFDLFVLSDTQDPEIALSEQGAFATLRAALPPGSAVWYRRRPNNVDRKSGNLGQWVETWGDGYQAMVVLDADSLMSAGALIQLADAMAADPAAGLIQSSPGLVGSNTLFGRAQQFATMAYGRLMSEGLAGWSGNEGNYWGHNAIIRTAAFAACAGLPRMPSLWREGGLIMSHDFVEAGLLRRSGWAVRFVPSIQGSYEQPPATLIDYALRDRRWCHGNLQHLGLLGTSGFHAISRFHLFHGAVSYLLSPAWFCLLVIWALLGNGPDSVITYFSNENPLYPIWPEMSHVSSFLILVFMYGMLLAPKVMGLAALGLTQASSVRKIGGRLRVALSFVTEVALSILFAPIMMVQQLLAVLRTTIGIRPVWAPQARKGGDYSVMTTAKFHALETVSGAALIAGMLAGVVSLWLLPIAVSLAAAVPLSLLSGLDLRRYGMRFLMATPEMIQPPEIVQLARSHKRMFRDAMERKLAAE